MDPYNWWNEFFKGFFGAFLVLALITLLVVIAKLVGPMLFVFGLPFIICVLVGFLYASRI